MKKPTLILIAPLLALAACGPSSTPGSSGGASSAETRITGLVLNDDGPLSKAKIEAKDLNGNTIARTESGGDAHYSIKIPAGAAYPLILSASAESEPQPLKAAVTSDLTAEQDISPMTTIVVDTAMDFGGLTEENLAKAAGAAIAQRKKTGGTTTTSGFRGDPTKQYGGWH